MIKMRCLYVICLFSFFFCGASQAADEISLQPNETKVIAIFQKASPRVVFIHRLNKILNKKHKTKQIVPAGTGSGIVWNNKGHIVTNFHVIKKADAISVTIAGKTVPASIVYSEPRKDIAVLKISSPVVLKIIKNYEDYKVAPTKSLLVGQTAIAIGNPYGLDHSLSVGVISALNRTVPGIGGVSIHNMIQTDAAVNPGNSGGPLLDSSGRLIGLNTVIFSKTGASAGVGFAVPADEIKQTVNQIIKHGRVKLAGIGITPTDPKLAKRLGVDQGILISEVLPNTPAASAKLRATKRDKWGRMHLGDVIVAIKGHQIKNYDGLYELLSSIKIGEEVVLTVRRDNLQIYHQIKTIDVAGL
ncbi:MAG: trypsin-like peptidase domain-containing protein [Legionellaceae bacterium]|nr:trypsin-like peptidase domain-containing protein [Legionellaceae bacterium]